MRIRRIFAGIVLGLSLATFVAADADPVSANVVSVESVDSASAVYHNFDNYSLWSCAYAGRPDGSWNVDHSGALAVWDGLVEYGCCIHDTDTGTQLGSKVRRDTNTGAIYLVHYYVPPYPFNCY